MYPPFLGQHYAELNIHISSQIHEVVNTFEVLWLEMVLWSKKSVVESKSHQSFLYIEKRNWSNGDTSLDTKISVDNSRDLVTLL